MVHLVKKDPRALIQRFSPLNQISQKYHSQLASQLRMIKVRQGDTIIAKARNTKLLHFLVVGSIDVRESFENRYTIDHKNDLSRQSLESTLADRSSVKAASDCLLLVANTDQIDQYLTWSQDYNIFYLDEGDLSVTDQDLIDDSFQEDWDNVFIRSKLAANLSNRVIHEVLSQLEDIEVKTNEVIVKANSVGDYFYVLKEGMAEVQTESKGPFHGARFKLNPGNYFGDEALVAGTKRNATVTMKSNGVLGRLSIDAFNYLIRQHLVSPLTADMNVSPGDHDVAVLDVRFPIEFKMGHEDGSVNLPINRLRKELGEFKQSLRYIVTPANDSRAELATYLMRQAGFEAYHLPTENRGEMDAVPA